MKTGGLRKIEAISIFGQEDKVLQDIILLVFWKMVLICGCRI